MKKYSATLLMLGVALVFGILHLVTGWQAAIAEASQHHQSAQFGEYVVEWLRDTFENLQSEFWQLAVQFALLAGFFEFMKVRAFEQDIEEVHQHLNRIEEKLDS